MICPTYTDSFTFAPTATTDLNASAAHVNRPVNIEGDCTDTLPLTIQIFLYHQITIYLIVPLAFKIELGAAAASTALTSAARAPMCTPPRKIPNEDNFYNHLDKIVDMRHDLYDPDACARPAIKSGKNISERCSSLKHLSTSAHQHSVCDESHEY